MKEPTDLQITAMRAVLDEQEMRTGERPTTTGDAWMALAVWARMHSPEWRDWVRLDQHRAPWLRRVL